MRLSGLITCQLKGDIDGSALIDVIGVFPLLFLSLQVGVPGKRSKTIINVIGIFGVSYSIST